MERIIVGTIALALILFMPVFLVIVCLASWGRDLIDKLEGN